MNEDIKNKLTKPFDRALVKERVGPGGRTLSYVAIGDYVNRLNDALEFEWSHEITEVRVLDDEVIVQVKLTAAGMIKMGLGGAAITKRRDNGQPVSIAHDVMAAEAVALKRAARLLGVGATLYSDDDDEIEPPARMPEQTRESTGSSPRISSAQLGKLRSLVPDWGAYRAQVRERHGVNVEFATRALASQLIDELVGANGNGHRNGNGHATGNRWGRP